MYSDYDVLIVAYQDFLSLATNLSLPVSTFMKNFCCQCYEEHGRLSHKICYCVCKTAVDKFYGHLIL